MSLETVKRLPETQASGVCAAHLASHLRSNAPISPSEGFLVWVFLRIILQLS